MRKLVVTFVLCCSLASVAVLADTFGTIYCTMEAIGGGTPGTPFTSGCVWSHQAAEQTRQNFNVLNSRLAVAEAAYISAISTSTLTHKTFDAEATGNVLTMPMRLSFAGAICQNATASTDWNLPVSNPAVAVCSTGTNIQKGTLDFADGASSLSAQRTLRLPADWSGAIDVVVTWLSSATTGNVVWQVATACAADGATDDPTFNTATKVTDAAKGTANQVNDAALTAVTATGCVAGSLVHVKVFRDPTDASDTMAATAKVVSVELTYRRAM